MPCNTRCRQTTGGRPGGSGTRRSRTKRRTPRMRPRFAPPAGAPWLQPPRPPLAGLGHGSSSTNFQRSGRLTTGFRVGCRGVRAGGRSPGPGRAGAGAPPTPGSRPPAQPPDRPALPAILRTPIRNSDPPQTHFGCLSNLLARRPARNVPRLGLKHPPDMQEASSGAAPFVACPRHVFGHSANR
jgi:hypothetical protein